MNLQSMKRQAVPPHAEVAAVIRHQVLSGELAPGSRRPAVRDLTQQLGVARMTVVRAMDTLEAEGLIERFSGRETFVGKADVPGRQELVMQAELSQILAIVEQLEVSVHENAAMLDTAADGREYRSMRRIHMRSNKPFCRADIRVDDALYELAPSRFTDEIVVSVFADLGVEVAKGHQNIGISYADFALAQALCIKVNSVVFRVDREFFDSHDRLIYSAKLFYPGDILELEIEFSTEAPMAA